MKRYLSEIREKGFTQINGAFDQTFTSMLKLQVETLFREKHPPAGATPFLNQGHQVIYNLQGHDPIFLRAFLRHHLIKSILKSELNDVWYRQIPPDNCNFILRAMAARNGGPAALPLHIDSFIPSSGRLPWSIQVAIVLEDQNEENGCTIFVPGSHLSDEYANQDLSRAIAVPSKAGDVVLWDSRTWHGTAANSNGKSRWSVISTFTRWWGETELRDNSQFERIDLCSA